MQKPLHCKVIGGRDNQILSAFPAPKMVAYMQQMYYNYKALKWLGFAQIIQFLSFINSKSNLIFFLQITSNALKEN